MSHPDSPETPVTPESTLEVAPASVDAEATELLAPAAPKKSGLKAALIAGLVVVALAIGIGAFAAYRMVFTSDAHPEESLPGSVLAYAALDFDPGLNQQAKLVTLAKKFPKIKDAGDPAKWISNFFAESDLKNVDVKKDLASWLGLRVGVGLWLNADGKPYALIAAESRNDDKAKAGLERVRAAVKDADLGYKVKDGTALIAVGERRAQEAVDAATADATKAPLSKNQAYTANRAWLPADEVLTLWADLDGIADALDKLLPEELGGMFDAQATQLKGTTILGARAFDTGLEIKARGFGSGAATPLATDPLKTLGGLPGSTVVGGSLGVPDLAEGAGGGMLGLLGGGMLGGGGFLAPGLTPGLTGPDFTELPQDPSFGDEDLADYKKFAEIQEAITNGLSNSVLNIAVSDVKAKVPGIFVEATAENPKNAESLFGAAKLLEAMGDVKVTRDGSKVTVTTTAYQAGSSGTLSGSALFGKATAGAPDQRTAAFFADVARLDTKSTELAPVKAVGVVVGQEGSDPVTLIRIVIE